jgi:hypothetical protein
MKRKSLAALQYLVNTPNLATIICKHGGQHLFFLVSGSRGSGKSTLIQEISGRLDNVECHDDDEVQFGDAITAEVARDEDSRCQKLEEFVQLALEKQEEGRNFLLATQSPLGELLACPSAPKLNGVAACLLDCSDVVRITRMRERGDGPEWPPNQDALGWASWHRMHAWDPQWEQRVIVGNGPAAHDYQRWTDWEQRDARWQVAVIDTTELSVEQMVDGVVEWVDEGMR